MSTSVIRYIGIFWLVFGFFPLFGANYDFKYMQEHSPVAATVKPEKTSPPSVVIKKLASDGAKTFADGVNAGGPIYGAGEAAMKGATYNIAGQTFTSKGLVQHLQRLSKTKRTNFLMKMGMGRKEAHAITKNMGKNLKHLGEKLDMLDKAGTYASAAGAAAGGDAVGVGQALANGTLSGSSAAAGGYVGGAAGTWLGVKAGATFGAAAGPAGAAVGAVGGAVLGSFLYEWYGKPTIDKAADNYSKDLQTAEEKAERQRRRFRTDFNTVYPNGYLGKPGSIDPDELHAEAERIRDNTIPTRPGYLDECPYDPNKTKRGFCGCGNPETDTDGDLVPDCIDKCPNNPKLPEPGPYGCEAVVPNLAGKSAEDAKSLLGAVGLTAALSVGKSAEDAEDNYKVASQSPVSGSTLNVGSEVSVILFGKYVEKKAKVPEVTGKRANEARIAITAAGLVAAEAPGDTAPKASSDNTVQAQSPIAGKSVKAQSVVTITLYGAYEKNEKCRKNQSRYYAAYNAENYTLCDQILNESKACAFAKGERSKLKQARCREASASYFTAMSDGDYNRARTVLTDNSQCNFPADRLNAVKCSENLSQMQSALKNNNINLYTSILSQSQGCGFHDSLSASLQQAQQRQNNRQLANVLGQILGGVLQGALHASNTSSNGGSKGGNPNRNAPPTLHQGTCNDVKKAGGNTPERHIIDLGRGGKSFLFEFDTYSVKDTVIVSQGSRVLFNSGCVGTKGLRSVMLKKRVFDSEVTVDVRPNCDNSNGTSWQFTVHCPKK